VTDIGGCTALGVEAGGGGAWHAEQSTGGFGRSLKP